MEHLLKQVAKVLAVNTNYATMISAPQYHHNKLKFIQLSRVDEHQILAVVVAEGNVIKNSIILNESAQSGATMNHVVLLPENIKQVRIDPCSFACAVTIKTIRVDDKVYTRDEIFANGDWIDETSVIFGTEDPNIILGCEGGRELGFEMEIVEMPEEMV